jgi:hypothetical protein
LVVLAETCFLGTTAEQTRFAAVALAAHEQD